MSHVRTRTFLCCLPVRFGVFVLTILGIAGGTLLAVVGWMQTIKLQGELPKANEIALYIHSALYTILAVVSIFGFIGATIKHRTMVSIFFMILVAHLTFSVISGAFALYNIFNTVAAGAIDKCVNNVVDGQTPPTEADCKRGYDFFKGIILAIFIVVWLLEIWGCVITNSYIDQLDDEMAANDQYPKQPDVEIGHR
jgi:hypothetical protein